MATTTANWHANTAFPSYVSGTPIPGMKDEALWDRNLFAYLGDY
jgi:hypothetical protein